MSAEAIAADVGAVRFSSSVQIAVGAGLEVDRIALNNMRERSCLGEAFTSGATGR